MIGTATTVDWVGPGLDDYTLRYWVTVNEFGGGTGSAFRLYDDDDFGLDQPPLPHHSLVNDQMRNYFKPAFIQVVDAAAYNPSPEIPFKSSETSFTAMVNARNLQDANSLWVCSITAAYQALQGRDNDPSDEPGPRYGETDTIGDTEHSAVFVECCREQYDELFRGTPGAQSRALELTPKWTVAIAAHEMGHHPGDQLEKEDHDEGYLMSEGAGEVPGLPENAKYSPKTILRFRKCNRWSH